jgi:hypothetical protein
MRWLVALPGASPVARAVLAVSLGACVVHQYGGPPREGRVQQPTRVVVQSALLKLSLNPHRCLDAKGGRAVIRGEVWVYDCHGRDNQRWTFSERQGTQVAIVGIGGLCLDAVAGPAGPEPTRVQLYPCVERQLGQTFQPYADGRIHEVGSGRCLTAKSDATTTPVTLEPCDVNDNGQVWIVAP